jgi:hypothetical protein
MSVSADDELVALDMHTSLYLAINSSGRGLWERLATEASEDELVTLLVDTYDIDADTATRDVRAFLRDLEAKGLLA